MKPAYRNFTTLSTVLTPSSHANIPVIPMILPRSASHVSCQSLIFCTLLPMMACRTVSLLCRKALYHRVHVNSAILTSTVNGNTTIMTNNTLSNTVISTNNALSNTVMLTNDALSNTVMVTYKKIVTLTNKTCRSTIIQTHTANPKAAVPTIILQQSGHKLPAQG